MTQTFPVLTVEHATQYRRRLQLTQYKTNKITPTNAIKSDKQILKQQIRRKIFVEQIFATIWICLQLGSAKWLLNVYIMA